MRSLGSGGVTVSAAFFQCALVGRTRVNAPQKIKKPGPGLIEAGARTRCFKRKAQDDVGGREPIAQKPRRCAELAFQKIEMKLELRVDELSCREAQQS